MQNLYRSNIAFSLENTQKDVVAGAGMAQTGVRHINNAAPMHSEGDEASWGSITPLDLQGQGEPAVVPIIPESSPSERASALPIIFTLTPDACATESHPPRSGREFQQQ